MFFVCSGCVRSSTDMLAYSMPSCPIEGRVTLGGRRMLSPAEAAFGGLKPLCKNAGSFKGDRAKVSRFGETERSALRFVLGLGGIRGMSTPKELVGMF